MPENQREWERVCTLDEIGDPGSFGFRHYAGKYPLYGFVVQKDGEVSGYRNICPHAGRPLDWAPHRFLTKDRSLIMCSAHGALFEIDTGLCFAGPCRGKVLRSVAVEVRDGVIYVTGPTSM